MSSTPCKPIDRSYRPDIDGLRAIAIVSVVLYHAGVPWVSGGFTGVDIFFVISGYLIGGHIFSEIHQGTFSYLRFYYRRAKRILPAFYGVLLFCVIASLVLLSPPETRLFGRSAFAATLSVSNVVFWHNSKYFDTRSDLIPFLMTWSLAVEEQFYAVIPLLMVLLARIRRNWILPAILAVCACSFVVAQVELNGQSQAAFQAAFYLLPARAWELGVGVALAVSEISLRRKSSSIPQIASTLLSLVGAILIVAPILLLNARSTFPGIGALPSVLGTALLMAVPSSWISRRLLSQAPVVFIGKVSYSWYLWHWPLLAFLHILYGSALPLSTSLFAAAAAFVIAVLSYYLIEQPFRRSTGAPARVLLRYGYASAVLVACCAAIWLSQGVPQRYPALAKMESANPPLWFDNCLVDDDAAGPSSDPVCYERSNPGPAVAIWGDSHAAAISPGIRFVARSQGYGFVQFTKTTCLPLSGVVRFIPRLPEHAAKCIAFNQKAFEQIEADPRIRIVVLTGEWSACFERSWEGGWLTADLQGDRQIPGLDAIRSLFVKALQKRIDALRDAGKYVVVLEDVPNFNPDPLWRVRNAHIPARINLIQRLGVGDAGDPGFAANNLDAAVDALAESSLLQSVSNKPGVELADLKPSLCLGANHCAYRDGDRLLYFDSGHLTAYGARYAVRDFHLPETLRPASLGSSMTSSLPQSATANAD